MRKKKEVKPNKCDSCLHGHRILSENGWHTNCSLSDNSFIKCVVLGTKDFYVALPKKLEDEKE